MAHGQRAILFDKLQQIGLYRLIQTAFIERVNFTFRHCVSCLSRHTWAYAQSEYHLLMHCKWFRTYYHFPHPHEGLRVPLRGLKQRYRRRTPVRTLGLTDRIWSVRDLLHYPVPQVASRHHETKNPRTTGGFEGENYPLFPFVVPTDSQRQFPFGLSLYWLDPDAQKTYPHQENSIS
jgi:hypothetical protein